MPNTFTANHNPRCLYHDSLRNFCAADETFVFGKLCENYHGEALTTTRDAWRGELAILKPVLSRFSDREGQILFEYDIPRLGKRVDAVLLLDGIVFCLEFKVGESRILEADVDQVLDYALDLKNFHRYSRDAIIVPVLIATHYREKKKVIQMA